MRKYRRLQSWYREVQLEVETATLAVKDRSSGAARQVVIGSRLPDVAVAHQPDLNFVSPEAYTHAVERIAAAKHEKAALDPNRLTRNMLSSMPLCFNVFGSLRGHSAFPALLSKVLRDEVSE